MRIDTAPSPWGDAVGGPEHSNRLAVGTVGDGVGDEVGDEVAEGIGVTTGGVAEGSMIGTDAQAVMRDETTTAANAVVTSLS